MSYSNLDFSSLEQIQEIEKEKKIDRLKEQAILKDINQNHNFAKKNKDIFEEKEKKYSTCPRYDPCVICDKCQNKASHLYVSCQVCKIPICTHTYKDRQYMIRRNNFEIFVDNDVKNELIELGNEYK